MNLYKAKTIAILVNRLERYQNFVNCLSNKNSKNEQFKIYFKDSELILDSDVFDCLIDYYNNKIRKIEDDLLSH